MKRNNGLEKEGMLFYPVVEVVSSGFSFCLRQIQGIIFGAWRANGNLSSANLLVSLDPPEFVLFRFTDGPDGPDETCPPIAAIVRRFCCLSSSFHYTCVFVLCHSTPSSAKSHRLTTHLTARAEQGMEEARTARRKLSVLSSYSVT